MDASSGTPNDMKAQLAGASRSSKDQLIITTDGKVSTWFSSQPVGEFLQQTHGNDVTVINAAGVDARTIKNAVQGMILTERGVDVAPGHAQISAAAKARYDQAFQERPRGAEAMFDERADPGRTR